MVGLSGVGKTTLLTSAENPIDKDVLVCGPVNPSILNHAAQFFYLLFRLVLASPISAFAIIRKPEWVRLLFKVSYRVAGIKQRSISSEKTVFLRDSGILMPIVSSMLDDQLKIKLYPIDKLLQLLPLPVTVVFILDDNYRAVYKRFVKRESEKGRDLSAYSPELFSSVSVFLVQLASELEKFHINVTKIYINSQGE